MLEKNGTTWSKIQNKQLLPSKMTKWQNVPWNYYVKHSRQNLIGFSHKTDEKNRFVYIG